MDKENFEYVMQVYDKKEEKYVHTLYNFIRSAEENNDDIYIGRNEGVFIACRNHSDCTLIIEKFFNINGYEIEKPQNYKPPMTMRKISYTASRKAYDYLMDEGSIMIKISTSAMKNNIKYYCCCTTNAIIVVYEDLVLYTERFNKNIESANESVKKLKTLYDIINIQENINDLFTGEIVYRTQTENNRYLYVGSDTNRLATTDKFGTVLHKSYDANIILSAITSHLVNNKWEAIKM